MDPETVAWVCLGAAYVAMAASSMVPATKPGWLLSIALLVVGMICASAWSVMLTPRMMP